MDTAAPCYLLQGILPVPRLLRTLLRTLSSLGSGPLGGEADSLWLGKGMGSRSMEIGFLTAKKSSHLNPFLHPIRNHLGEFFLLAFVQIGLENKHEIEGLVDPFDLILK